MEQKKYFAKSCDFLKRVRRWLAMRRRPWGVRRERQLRLCENLALGERRFLSVVQCGQQRFLVGGNATSVAVLAELTGGTATAPEKDDDDVPTYKSVGGKLTKDGLCG